MPTALTLYGLSTAATTLPQDGLLTTTGPGGTTTIAATPLGTATGFGEIVPQGTTNAWPALASLPGPTGMGFLFDVTTLEKQQLVAGNWTPTFRLNVNVSGTITADLYCLFWLYYNGIFWPCSSTQGPNYALLAGQTISLSAANYVFPATMLPPLALLSGYKLGISLMANVTNNPLASGSLLILTVANTTTGSANCQIVTPGYQALTGAQLQNLYTFGGFVIHNGMDVFLQQKNFDFPERKQVYFHIARNVGDKKTGEVINVKQIPVSLRITGYNRADVEQKWDAMQQALSYEQQALKIHALDGRYWIADALRAPMAFQPGKLQSTPPISILFAAQNPYPYAATAQSFVDSGAASNVSTGVWARTGIAIWRQGTATAFPQIVVQNNTVSNNTTLTTGLTNGTPVTSLTVASLLNAALAGDTYQISDGAGHTMNVVIAVTAGGGSTTLQIVSATPNFSYPGSGASTVQRVTTITGVTLNDTSDLRAVTFTGLSITNAPQSLTVITDPLVSGGQTGTVAGGAPLGFSGIWPRLQSALTIWTVQVSCLSQPTIQTTWTWTPRTLS